MCSLESRRTPHQEYRNVGESGTCRGRGCECVGGWCVYIYVYIYVSIYVYIYIYIYICIYIYANPKRVENWLGRSSFSSSFSSS